MSKFFMSNWAPLINTNNYNPAQRMVRPIKGLVLHLTGGSNVLGTKATFEAVHAGTIQDPKRSAHFCCPRQPDSKKQFGTFTQFIDTDVQAWAQGSVSGNEQWISIENEGTAGKDALTNHQIEMCAYLFAWLSLNESVPLAISNSTSDSGLSHHSLFVATGCPGTLVINQRSAILVRAQELVNSTVKYALQWPS